MKKSLKIIVAAIVLFLLSVIYAYGDTATAIYNKVYDSDNSGYINSGIISEGTIEQQLIIKEDNFTGFKIKPVIIGDVSGVELEYEIIDVISGEVCVKGKIPATELKNEKFKKITFDKRIEDSKDKQYNIILKEKNARNDAGIGLYYVPEKDAGNLLQIQGHQLNGTLLIQSLTHKFNVERFIVVLLFVVYIIIFLKILYKLFK